ncbi:MAG: c-type cytochrome [Candidatus Eisenbacteria bacterium]
MGRWTKAGIGLLILLIATIVGVAFLVQHGFSAREKPTAVETLVARTLRRLSVPNSQRDAKNPVSLTPEVLAQGRAHFADHCAGCHGNDGRGKTIIGQNLYPKVPDMWAKETQSLSDGEIFYIIKNGVRLTGMAAWGEDSPEDDRESWHLVHFIRHLPQITVEELAEMRELNPKTRAESQQEEAERVFLEGRSAGPAPKEDKLHRH